MTPGAIVELVGKVTIRASFGTIGYKAPKKDNIVAWALILPTAPTPQMLRDALKAALANAEAHCATAAKEPA